MRSTALPVRLSGPSARERQRRVAAAFNNDSGEN